MRDRLASFLEGLARRLRKKRSPSRNKYGILSETIADTMAEEQAFGPRNGPPYHYWR